MSGVIAKYHCNYCQEDITGVRVKCAECPDFDLCLQCFSCGAEMGAHKNRHGYQLIDCGNFPIFQAPCNWKAKEELVLLEAIEQYGFGNWEDVSQCLPARSCEEVQEHYNSHYIEGNIGRATWSTDVSTQIKDHTVPEGGPLSPSLSSPVATVDITSTEQQELGYMPCRDDYEREYDNEAESLISQLSMGGPDEDELEVALKLAQVDMYSRRLRERLRRKGLVRDYRLLEQFCHTGRPASKASPVSRGKKPAREADKELQEKMRIFCQFQSATEHDQLLENLEREKELKARIKELLRYRRNGITKLDECSEFDVARHRREKRKEAKKKSFALNAGTRQLRSQKAHLNGIKKIRRKRRRRHYAKRTRGAVTRFPHSVTRGKTPRRLPTSPACPATSYSPTRRESCASPLESALRATSPLRP
ncbi:transcriptional adapter 2-beta isoform X3 [Dermacentor albipictus]|uniref:transcriptional adapter 2-beta isoform X3 n=1 Tax=Dermacentor albipictus TaxID=60249 RepID=UPI0031FCD192